MLTKSLALDYINKKIRVNTLSLGYFKTPMTMKSFKVQKKEKLDLIEVLLKDGENQKIL